MSPACVLRVCMHVCVCVSLRIKELTAQTAFWAHIGITSALQLIAPFSANKNNSNIQLMPKVFKDKTTRAEHMYVLVYQ